MESWSDGVLEDMRWAHPKNNLPHHCAVRAELVEAQAALRQAQHER
jgi:hypothetical protein